ncbi:hypothetical protein K440DRAFT_641478 [Wilcoxina mikolae CBS 423.85]|nr:hypothetical protein K440DRAFT_641478 [Wilcoxina mikolae CBS 423.85]
MAEAISFGASVLAFITIAAQLSKTAATLYGTIHDAPDDVRRVHTRLRDLEYTLAAIDRIRKRHSSYDEDQPLQVREYWNEKFEKLRCDFSEFKKFTETLNANAKGVKAVKGRVQWFLSHQD